MSTPESGVGLDEAWEVVTRMAGGANVGPRFLSLARLVVSLDKRLAEVEGRVDGHDDIGRLRVRLLALETRVQADEWFHTGQDWSEVAPLSARVPSPDSQSSTKTPGIGADMEQADGERLAKDIEHLAIIASGVVSRAPHPDDPSAFTMYITKHNAETLAQAAAALRSAQPAQPVATGLPSMAPLERAKPTVFLDDDESIMRSEVRRYIYATPPVLLLPRPCGAQDVDQRITTSERGFIFLGSAPSELDEDAVEREHEKLSHEVAEVLEDAYRDHGTSFLTIANRILTIANRILTACRLSPAPISQPTPDNE